MTNLSMQINLSKARITKEESKPEAMEEPAIKPKNIAPINTNNLTKSKRTKKQTPRRKYKLCASSP